MCTCVVLVSPDNSVAVLTENCFNVNKRCYRGEGGGGGNRPIPPKKNGNPYTRGVNIHTMGLPFFYILFCTIHVMGKKSFYLHIFRY